MACSVVIVGVLQCTFEKGAALPQRPWPLLDNEGGKHKELHGDLKVGSAAFTWEQLSLPLIEVGCVATSQITPWEELCLDLGFGVLVKCESLCLGSHFLTSQPPQVR